jgi:disulfide bond formation protein DsbB
MELVRDITLILHFIGLAMIIGPFLVQMRAHSGYYFGWVMIGSLVQLVTGLLLTGLAEMGFADNPDAAVNHTKIAVKSVIATVIVIAAISAYRKQKKLAGGDNERKLLPYLHTAGALAIVNVILAVVWTGVVR